MLSAVALILLITIIHLHKPCAVSSVFSIGYLLIIPSKSNTDNSCKNIPFQKKSINTYKYHFLKNHLRHNN